MREGITFEYEPQVFILRPDLRYIPDFYLPSLNLWIEIKGWTRPEHLEKIRLFQVTTGMEIKLIGYPEILNYLPDGQSYYKFMKLWKQKHNLPLASVESSTTYNQNSLAA